MKKLSGFSLLFLLFCITAFAQEGRQKIAYKGEMPHIQFDYFDNWKLVNNTKSNVSVILDGFTRIDIKTMPMLGSVEATLLELEFAEYLPIEFTFNGMDAYYDEIEPNLIFVFHKGIEYDIKVTSSTEKKAEAEAVLSSIRFN